ASDPAGHNYGIVVLHFAKLNNPFFQQVMQMYDSVVLPVLQYEELGDIVLPHAVKRMDGQFISVNGSGCTAHDVGGGKAVHVGVFLQHPPDVAVCDDAGKLRASYYGHGAEAVLGDGDDDFAYGRIGCHGGAAVLGGQVGHFQVQAFSQGPSGVIAGKDRKSTRLNS